MATTTGNCKIEFHGSEDALAALDRYMADCQAKRIASEWYVPGERDELIFLDDYKKEEHIIETWEALGWEGYDALPAFLSELAETLPEIQITGTAHVCWIMVDGNTADCIFQSKIGSPRLKVLSTDRAELPTENTFLLISKAHFAELSAYVTANFPWAVPTLGKDAGEDNCTWNGVADSAVGELKLSTKSALNEQMALRLQPFFEGAKSVAPDLEIDTDTMSRYELTEDGTLALASYEEGETDVSIPSTVGDLAVTKVRADAFAAYKGSAARKAKRKSITHVTIPDGVKEIGYDAFHGCTGLTEITIPESVEHIGPSAFFGCEALTGISLPKTVKYIGPDAFKNCTALTQVTMPEHLPYLQGKIFDGCSKLVNKDRLIIAGDMMMGCTGRSAKQRAIPEGVRRIGPDAFCYDEKLERISIPESVTEIMDRAFYCCGFLDGVTLPRNLTVIGPDAFSGCSSLSAVDLPQSLISIECAAFQFCRSLRRVVIPDGITVISRRVFSDCTSLEEVVVPPGVTEIEARAFCECPSLSRIVIPEKVTVIGDAAFQGCTGLRELILLGDVKELGKNIFMRCSDLIVRAPAGSCVEEYLARKRNVKFEAL